MEGGADHFRRVVTCVQLKHPLRHAAEKLLVVHFLKRPGAEHLGLHLTGQGQDGVRFGAKILQKFGYLTRGVSVVDFPPTDQDREALESIMGQLRDHEGAIAGAKAGYLDSLNRLLAEKGANVIGG